MTTFADSDSLSDDTLDTEKRLTVNLGRSRRFNQEMVEDGFYGVEVGNAMTFVAVEAALIQTNNGFVSSLRSPNDRRTGIQRP